MDMAAHYLDRVRQMAAQQTPEQVADMDRREQALRQQQNREYMRRVGVPDRFIDDVYSEKHRVNHKPLRDAARFWQADHKRVSLLVLAGRFGVGKSVAAAQYIKLRTESLDSIPAKTEQTYPCWHYAVQICWRGMYSDDLQKMANVPILVIDDLGAEHADAKGAFASVLTGIVTMRHDRYLPTILTTNMTGQAFTQHYQAERLYERIRQSGWYCEQDETVDIVRQRCDADGAKKARA